MLADTWYDDSAFLRGLDKADAVVQEAVRSGIERALMQAYNHAVNQIPAVPLQEGTLRGSASVHVDGKFKAAPKGPGATEGTPNTSDAEEEFAGLRDAVGGIVAFNTPYAARLHEGHEGWEWSETGSGPKYLESKMQRNAQVYIAEVVRTIKRALGK